MVQRLIRYKVINDRQTQRRMDITFMPCVKYISPFVREFVDRCHNLEAVWNELETLRAFLEKFFVQSGSSDSSHYNCTLSSWKNV
jgi:hypothetical protein